MNQARTATRSPGFNPPYFDSQVYVAPCSLPSYNPAAQDCSVPGLSVLSQGFPSDALSEPNTPSLFSLSTNLRTPYVMQWPSDVSVCAD